MIYNKSLPQNILNFYVCSMYLVQPYEEAKMLKFSALIELQSKFL